MPKLYDATLYHIKTLTNLHVGNGETNYSVIDKQVQRDPLTNLPTINASSLKGATKEAMRYGGIRQDDPAGEGVASELRTIFGSDPQDNEQKAKQGYVNFFDAKLLSLPVRCDKVPYLRATSIEVLKEYISYCKQFDIECSLDIEKFKDAENDDYACGHSFGSDPIAAEEWKYNALDGLEDIAALLGGACVLMRDEHFRTLTDELPFVARNYLEDGRSENLWYEEIVPRESLFYVVLQRPTSVLMAHLARKEGDILDKNEEGLEQRKKNRKKDALITAHLDAFGAALDEMQLFIGANTTVGYGLCQISAISTTKPATTQKEPTEEESATEGAPS